MWVPSSVIYEFFKKTWRIGFYFYVFKTISLKSLWSMFFALEPIAGNVGLTSVESQQLPI